MSKRTRSRNGVEAKRRRARIARRNARATVDAMRAVSPRYRITLRGWDSLRRQFKVDIQPLVAVLRQPEPSPALDRFKAIADLFSEGRLTIAPPLPEVGQAAIDYHAWRVKNPVTLEGALEAAKGGEGRDDAEHAFQRITGLPPLYRVHCLAIIENDRGEADTCELPRGHEGGCDWRVYR